MFGGCERKMYYIRDTRSKVFKEAYFVLREGADSGHITESDLATEADRILRERFPERKRRISRSKVARALYFIVGVAVGVGVVVLF